MGVAHPDSAQRQRPPRNESRAHPDPAPALPIRSRPVPARLQEHQGQALHQARGRSLQDLRGLATIERRANRRILLSLATISWCRLVSASQDFPIPDATPFVTAPCPHPIRHLPLRGYIYICAQGATDFSSRTRCPEPLNPGAAKTTC